MHKTGNNLFAGVSLCLLVLLALTFAGLFGYFSDVQQVWATVISGSVQPEITDLTPAPKPEEQVRLVYGRVLSVSFTLNNAGASEITADIVFSAAFLDDLSERGSFYVFPAEMEDSQILSSAPVFAGAIVGAGVPDNTGVWTQAGIRPGIQAPLEQRSLAPGGHAALGYKLLFYPDAADMRDFNVRDAACAFTAVCDVAGRATQWQTSVAAQLPVLTITDVTPPEIQRLPGNTTFFVTQTDGLDLKSYAAAVDDFDGDVTDRIVITAQPDFDRTKAGTYAVTYTVSDRAGNTASLTIEIVIWNFIKLESGNYHTLALTSHGRVYAWGYNDSGQLGDGTAAFKSVPQRVAGLDGITDIAAGTGSSYALHADGTLYAWGYNAYGQLGDGTTGARNVPTRVNSEVRFTSISTYHMTAGAIAQNGDVYTWGYGDYGAAGTGDGTDNRVPTKINVTDAVRLSMGYYNGAAVTSTGVLYTWGDNYHGQLGTGRPMAIGANAPAPVTFFIDSGIKVASVGSGWYHMVAVTDAGEVYTWGYGADGRLGNGSALDRNVPQKIALENAVEVQAAYYHSAVRDQNGAVYFFGQNAYGKHGTGNTATHTTPVIAPGIGNATSVALALDSSFVLVDGQLTLGMGYGGTGVLGNGASANYNYPVQWAFIPPEPY